MAIHAAGAIIFDDRRRILLIRRGQPPGFSQWSVPGGKCQPGEDFATTCAREVLEETHLRVQVDTFIGRVSRPAPAGESFVIEDFRCTVLDGSAQAGDDAAEIGWFSRADLDGLDLVESLLETLTVWGQLPD